MTADTDDEADVATASPGGSGIGMEAFLGLLWLGTSAYVAHASLQAPGAEVGPALQALPGLVPAMLLTSAGIASIAAGRLKSALGRLALGLGVGAIFGVVGGVAVRYGYGDTPSITDLAVAMALAGLIGGSAAALPEPVREAFQWATTFVFFAAVIAGTLRITGVLGGGLNAPEDAQAAASEKFGYIGAVVGGLLAGLYSPPKLRDQRSWAWYPIAGALPGVLLLIADRLTAAGDDARAGQFQFHDANGLRHALIVLVIGAVGAAILGIRQRRRGD